MSCPGSPGRGEVNLVERVAAVLGDAAALYGTTPWGARLQTTRDDLAGPLRVALVGRVKSGKSTLLNALVGCAVAATDAGECTRVVTWYSWGSDQRAWAVLRAGARTVQATQHPSEDQRTDDRQPHGEHHPLELRRTSDRLVLDLAGLAIDDLARLHVELPLPALREVTLIDTPGMASLSPDAGLRTGRYLEGESGPGPDAVIYLMRQLHAGDVNFLEAFRGPQHRAVPPVHALGVLSRADELGGGRPDALELAAGVAAGYAQDPRLRPLVQTVLPIAGLLAEAGATLTGSEHADLVAMAGLPEAVTAPLLLSATRFAAPRRYLPVSEDRRRSLLDRLGLVGVRMALAQLRACPQTTSSTRDNLAANLVRASGLEQLRTLLASRFTARRDVLKAEAALRLIEQAVTASPMPGGRRLAAQVERIRLGVHDFDELRVLNDVRVDGLGASAEDLARMERLLGAHGPDPATRLGLGAEPSIAELAEALQAEHRHWQATTLDPLASPQLARAAAVLQRTCEGIRRQLANQAGNSA